MKAQLNLISKLIRNLSTSTAAEQRQLMSADPIVNEYTVVSPESGSNVVLQFTELLNGEHTLGSLVNQGGYIAPGNSPGTLTVDRYENNAGTLEIEIFGTGAGQYDVVDATSTTITDGTLALKLDASYNPNEGDQFVILTSDNAISGAFSALTGFFDVSKQVYFDVDQTDNAITLTAHSLDSIIPDFAVEYLTAVNADKFGELLNIDYLDDQSISFDASISTGVVDISGTFSGAMNTTLEGDRQISISASGASAKVNFGGNEVASVNDLEFKLAVQDSHEAGGRDGSYDGYALSIHAGDASLNFGSSVSATASDFVLTQGDTVSLFDLVKIDSMGANATPVADDWLIFGGEIDIQVDEMVRLDGEVFFKQDSVAINVGGVEKTADALIVGAQALGGFAGLNGGWRTNKDGETLRDADGQPFLNENAIGLAIDNVDLALGIYAEGGQTWTAVNANVGTATIAGIDGVTASLAQVSFTGNFKSADGSLVDFNDGTDANALKQDIALGSQGLETIALEMDADLGQYIKISTGTASTLNMFDSVVLSGGFAIERAEATEEVTLSDGSTANVNVMRIGGDSISAFVGSNGTGIEASSITFALGVFSDIDHPERQWMALDGTADGLGLTGIDGVTLEGQNLSLELNRQLSGGGINTLQTNAIYQVNLSGDVTLDITYTPSEGDAVNRSFTVAAAATDDDVKAALASNLATLMSVSEESFAITGTRATGFEIEFIGELAGQAVELELSAQAVGYKGVSFVIEDGSDTNNEVQGRQIEGSGSYSLSFTHNGQRVQTAVLDANATAAEVQTAINAALATLEFTEVVPVDSQYSLTFTNAEGWLQLEAKLGGAWESTRVVIGPEVDEAALESRVADGLASLLGLNAVDITIDLTLANGEATGTISIGGKLAGQNVELDSAFVTYNTEAQSALESTKGSEATFAALGSLLALENVYTGRGTFALQIVDQSGNVVKTTSNIRFTQTDHTNQTKHLKTALTKAVGSGNYSVLKQMSSGSSNQYYTIKLTGDFAGYSLALVNNVSGSDVSLKALGQSSTVTQAGADEVQRLDINAFDSGAYKLTFAHNGTLYETAAITYNASAADVQTKLQQALDGVTTVTVTSPSTRVFDITFSGALSHTDVDSIDAIWFPITDAPNLTQTQVGGTTTQVITGATVTVAETTFATTHLDPDNQAIANTEYTITFNGNLANTDVSQVRGIIETVGTGEGSLSQVQAGGEEYLEYTDKPVVIDFKAMKEAANSDGVGADDGTEAGFSITTATGNARELTMDGALGELTRAAGNVKIGVAGFVEVEGDFAFEMSTQVFTEETYDADGNLTDTQEVEVKVLSAGVNNASGHVGTKDANGDLDFGVQIQGVNLGLLLVTDNTEGSTDQWLALHATVESASLKAFDGIEATLSTVEVELNMGVGDTASLLDFSAAPYSVVTGPATTVDGKEVAPTVDLTSDAALGTLLRVSGHLKLNLFGAVELDGDFALDRSEGEVHTYAEDENNVETLVGKTDVEILTLGINDAMAFIGTGGADNGTGIKAYGVNAAALLVTSLNSDQKWLALKAEVGFAGLVGVDGIEANISQVTIELNRSSSALEPVLDFSGDNAFDIKTGPTSTMTLEMDGALGTLTRASGQVALAVDGFVRIAGEFAFEVNEALQEITLGDATTRQANIATFGIANASGFAGIESSGVGVYINDVNLALALIETTAADNGDDAAKAGSWYALQAQVGGAFLNVSDDIYGYAQDINLKLNRQSGVELAQQTVVDFAGANALEVKTGAIDADGNQPSQTIDMAGADGALTELAGSIALSLAGFVTAQGQFSLTHRARAQYQIYDETDDSTTEVELEELTLGMSQVSAFVGLNGGTDEAMGLEVTGGTLALQMVSELEEGGQSWSAVKASLGSAALVGVEGVTARLSNASLVANFAAEDGSLLDFNDGSDANPYAQTVSVGPEVDSVQPTEILDMDAQRGQFIEVTGVAELNLFNFVNLYTEFGLSKFTQTVETQTDAGTEQTEVEVLAFGGRDGYAFAGVNGGWQTETVEGETQYVRDADGQLQVGADALGLLLSNVEFGLALVSDGDRSWTALDASVGSAQFAGLDPDDIKVEAKNLGVEINLAADASLGTLNLDSTSIDVLTGPDASLTLDIKAETKRVFGEVELNLFNFFMVDGAFNFTSQTDTVQIDGQQVEVDTLTVGAENVYAFAGVNGGWKTDANGDYLLDRDGLRQASDSATGLVLREVDFGLAFVADGADKWTALSATVGAAGFAGFDSNDVVIEARSLEVDINLANDGVTRELQLNEQALTVGTGPATTIDLTASAGSKRVAGEVELRLFDFFMVDGNFGFSSEKQTVRIDGEETEVDAMTIGASDVYAFAGVNGGWKTDANGDYVLDSTGSRQAVDDAVGLVLKQVDFGLAFIADGSDKWTALTAKVGEAGFAGFDSDDLTIKAKSLFVEINQASDGNTRALELDQQALTVSNGPSSTIDITAQNNSKRVSGEVELNLFNFFMVDGAFDFSSQKQTVLIDGAETEVDAMTIGANDVYAFAGVNGGWKTDANGDYTLDSNGSRIAVDNAVGLVLKDVDFGLAFIADGSDKWTALTAQVGEAGFAGFDSNDVTIRARSLQVEINQASDGNVRSLDLDQQALTVNTGPETTLDISAAPNTKRVSGEVELNLFNFLMIDGSFDFSSKTQTVQIDGADVEVDAMTIGAGNVYAFAGVNGGWKTDANGDYALDSNGHRVAVDNAVGLVLADVDFALAFLADGADKWTALTATVGSASFAGFDSNDISITARSLKVEINQASDGYVRALQLDQAPLTVSTGPSTTLDITAMPNVKRVAGEVELRLFDFFMVDGSFDFSSATQEVMINGELKSVDAMTIGAGNVYAFAGVDGGWQTDANGDYLLDANGERMLVQGASGVVLKEVDFGAAFIADGSDKWTALTATAGSIAIEGISDDITLEATGISVQINQASEGNNNTLDLDQQALTVSTGPASTIDLVAENDSLALMGTAAINIAGLARINGTIAVSTVNRVFTDSSSQNFRFKGLSVATADGELFAGVDGTGIRASNVNFTLLTGAQELDADKKYTAIYARVENFAFEGIDTSTLGLEASAIELLYNKSSGDHATIDFTAVGYSAGERFESSKIETMDGEVSTVAFDASIDVFGLITLEGSISFSVEADYVEIAFTDMDTFVGYSTADGEVYGLAIDNLDLTLKADGDGVSVSYIFADGLAIKAGDILEIEIDAKALSSMILNSEGVLKTGPIGFDIGILKFSGEFAISKTVQTVATEVDDAGNVLATEDVNFLTFGGQNLQTFFGVSGVGLQLSDIDFAFALAVSGFNVRAVLDARVGSVALVGIPMIEISASDIDISMQKSIYGSGDAYNFASSSVALPTGDDGAGGIARHDINMDNELGYHDIALSIGVAKLSVFSILHIEGAISFNISEVDGVSVFQLQATGLTGLVGIRGDSSVALADDSDASGVMINLADFDLQVVKGGTLKYVGASIEKLQVQNLFGLSFGFDAEEAGRTLDLQMHGTTVVLSDLDFNLGGFVKFRGGVAFGMTDVTLYDKNSDNTFEGKALNLGISAEQAQVGTGDAFGTPQTGMGFMMRDVNFAMAAISYKDALNQKLNVTAVKLSAQEIGLYGFGDNFKLQVEGISLDFVQHSQGNPTVIDFSQSYAVLDGNADKYGGLAIQTGGQPVVFQSAQDEVFKLSFRDSLLQISSFVYVKGGVSFELVKNQMMPVNLGELNSVIAKLPEAAREIINAAMDPEKMVRDVVKGLSTDAINALLPADSAISGAVSDMADEALDTLIDSIKAKIEDMIGFKLPTAVYDNGTVIGYNLPMNGFVLAIKDVTAFVGINGPVFAGEPDNGAIGFQVTDLDLAVTFFQPSSIPVVGSWLNFITVKGNMRSAQVIGLDSAITMKIEDAELQLNTFFMTTNIVIGTVPIDPIINVGLQLIQAPFVDYSKIENGTADNGYLIRFGIPDENGNQPTELIDFDDNFIAVDVDYVHLELTAGGAASIQIIGGASFYKRGGEEVILNNGEKIKVWSLGFSLTNGNAFVGYKKYFNDTNGDGRIYRTAPGLVTHVDGTTDTYGADDINKEAIGLAIDDFNIGAVFMREHASLNMFFAAKLSLRGAGLVGVNRKFVYMEIGDITGKSNNDTYQVPSNPLVQVDVNLAFGLRGFTTVVDFSRSGKDEDGNETAYKLGTRSTAMTLDYSTMLIYARANIDFGILDQGNQFDDNGDLTVSALDKSQYLVSAYGQLEFKLTPDEVNLFINVGGSLNIANLFTLDAQATGVLILDNRGLAASFKVSTSLHLETSSGFEILDTAAAVYLDINTTGENIEYRVPVELLSKMGASDRPDNMDDKGVITISNIAPGNTTPSRAYAALRFEGHMSVANGIIEVSDLGAGIIFEVPQGGGVQVRLYATGIAHIGSFAQLGVAIDLSFGTQGVWGNLQLGDPAGNSKILDFGFATLYGGIGISFNSTSSAKTMKGLATDSEGNITGVVDISVPAETLRLRAGVRLDLAGLITAKGSLDVTIDSQGIRGTFQASIDLVLAKADALFIVDIGYGASTYFRAYGDINITIGVSILSVNVNGKLRINTKNEDWSVANGTVKAQSIRVDFSSSADLYILKLNLNGALYVDLANPEVILSGSASGKFLGIFNISGAFLASSKGTVYLAVTAGIGIDISFKIFGWRFTIFKFQISFGIEITTNSHMLGNLDTSGSISAKNATQLMDYYLNLGNGQRAFNGISFLAVGKGELVIMNVGISLTLGMALTPEEFVLFQGSGGSKKPSGDKVNWFDTGASYAGLPSNAVVFDTGASAFDGQKVVFLPGTSRRNDQNELHDELAAYGGFNYTDDIYWLATEQTLASGAGPDSNAAVYGELPSDPAAAAKVAAAADAQNVDWIDMNSDIKSELAFASVPANGDIDDADILLEGHGIDDYDDMKVDPGDPTRHLLQGSDGKYYEYKLFKDGEVDYSITTTTTDSEGNTTTTTTNHTASGSYYKLVATHDSKPDATPPEVPDEASSDDSATKNSKYGRVFAQWKRSDYSFDPASMSGSTMTLNVGSRSGNRGLMTTVESEEYELYRYANGTVEVRTLGQDKKTYSNVNSLSANFGSGADKLTLLGEWDNVTLNIDMGSGEDELDIRSRVAGGTLRGGSGNDVIKFVTATTIYGDGGDDDITQYHKADAMYANTTIYGGAGYSIIQLYGGNNTINVDNDSQTVDVLNGLDGSSIAPANLTVNALNGGNVLVNSGSALAQETINYKIAATATDQNIEIGRSSVDGDGTDEYRIETRSGAIVVDHDVDRLIVDGSGLTGEVGLVALSKSSDMWQLGETGANASENMVYLNFENANVRNELGSIVGSNSALILTTDGLSGQLNTELKEIAVSNTYSGADAEWIGIDIKEKDSLTVLGTANSNAKFNGVNLPMVQDKAGLYTQRGEVRVELLADGSLLRVNEGGNLRVGTDERISSIVTIADDIEIVNNAKIWRMTYGTVTNSQTDARRDIQVAGSSSANAYNLSVDELNRIEGGNQELIIGSANGSHKVTLGNNSNATSTGIAFSNTVHIMTPAQGGHLDIEDDVDVSNGGFWVTGSGNTTVITQDAAEQATSDDADAKVLITAKEISIDDSIKIDGAVELRTSDANGDITLGGQRGIYLSGTNAVSNYDPDTLRLDANQSGDVTIAVELKSDDGTEAGYLDGLEIVNANDVSFKRRMVVTGDVVIEATGTVRFAESVEIRGGSLTILGADKVIFDGRVTVGGDVTIQANNLDYNSNLKSTANGVLNIYTTDATQGIDMGDLGELVIGRDSMEIDKLELSRLSGFSNVIIGNQADTQAAYNAGASAAQRSSDIRVGVNDTFITRNNMTFFAENWTLVDDASFREAWFAGNISVTALGDITLENTLIQGFDANRDSLSTEFNALGAVVAQVGMDNYDNADIEMLNLGGLTVQAGVEVNLTSLISTSVEVLQTGDGDLSLTELAAGGDLSVISIDHQGSSGNISLQTTEGAITLGGLTSSAAGSLAIEANGSSEFDLSITGAMTANSASDVSLAATGALSASETLDFGIATRLEMTAQTNVSLAKALNANGVVDITAHSGDISLDALNNTGDIHLVAGGDVIVNDDAAADIVSDNSWLWVEAGGGFGTADAMVHTSVANLSLSLGEGAYIVESSDLTVAKHAASSAYSAISVAEGSTGALILRAAGDLTLQNNVALLGSNVVRVSGDQVDIQGNVSILDGSMSIESAGDTLVSNSIDLSGATASLSVVTGGALVMTDGGRLQTRGRDIAIDVAGDATLGNLNSAGSIQLAVDGNMTAASASNVLSAADQIDLQASQVGTAAASLTLNASAFTLATTGDAYLDLTNASNTLAQSAASVDVDVIGDDASVSAWAPAQLGTVGAITGGDLRLDAGANALRLSAAINTSGNLLAQANTLTVEQHINAGAVAQLTVGTLEQAVSTTISATQVMVEADALAQADSASISADEIWVKVGDIELANITADTAVIEYQSVVDAGDTHVDLVVSDLRIFAGEGASFGATDNAIETSLDMLSGAISGAATMAETDDLRVVQSSDVAFAALNVDMTALNLQMTAATGLDAADLTLSAGGNVDADANVSATALKLTAAQSIRIADNVVLSVGSAALNATAGNITLAQAATEGKINATGTLALNAAGDIDLGYLRSEGEVSLTAGGNIVDGDSAVDVMAQRLTLQAAQIGASADHLETQVELLGSTSSGDVFITESGSLTVSQLVTTGAGNVSLQVGGDTQILDGTGIVSAGDVDLTVTGDLLVGRIQSADTVTLIVSGDVRDGEAALDITAKALILDVGAFGSDEDAIELAVETLSGDATAGLNVDNTGDLVVEQLASTGDMTLAADGDLSVGTLEAANIDLDASGAIVAQPLNHHITAQHLALNAGLAIGEDGAMLQTTVDALSVEGAQSINLNQSKDLAIVSVVATDSVHLVVDGNIADHADDNEVDFSAARVDISTSADFGASDAGLELLVDVIDIESVGAVVFSTLGDSLIEQVLAGTVADLNLNGTTEIATIQAADIQIDFAGQLNAAASQDAQLIAASLSIDGAGDVGREDAPLNTAVDTLNVVVDGDVYLLNSQSMTAELLEMSNGTIDVSAGDLTVERANVDTATLTSAGNVAITQSLAQSLTVNAGGNVGIEDSTAQTLTINAAGNVDIASSRAESQTVNTDGHLTIDDANGGLLVVNVAGNAQLNASVERLQVLDSALLTMAQTGDLQLLAINADQVDLTVLGNLSRLDGVVTADSITLDVSGDIGAADSALQLSAATADLQAANADLNALTALTLNADVEGVLQVTSTEDLTVGAISAKTVKLEVANVLGTASHLVSAETLQVTTADVGGNVDATALNTAIKSLELAVSGQVVLSNQGDMVVSGTQSAGSSVSLSGSGAATLQNLSTEGEFVLSASGLVSGFENVQMSALTLDADQLGSEAQRFVAQIDALSATLQSQAWVELQGSSHVQTLSASAVNLSVEQDLQLGQLETTGGAELKVGGAIIDTDADLDITASRLMIQAGIDAGSADNPLEVNVELLESARVTDGGLYLSAQSDLKYLSIVVDTEVVLDANGTLEALSGSTISGVGANQMAGAVTLNGQQVITGEIEGHLVSITGSTSVVQNSDDVMIVADKVALDGGSIGSMSNPLNVVAEEVNSDADVTWNNWLGSDVDLIPAKGTSGGEIDQWWVDWSNELNANTSQTVLQDTYEQIKARSRIALPPMGNDSTEKDATDEKSTDFASRLTRSLSSVAEPTSGAKLTLSNDDIADIAWDTGLESSAFFNLNTDLDVSLQESNLAVLAEVTDDLDW